MNTEIISTIIVDTKKYHYILKPDGTRDIDTERAVTEQLTFQFNTNSLRKIIMRDNPSILRVDDKELYFDYSHRNGMILLTGIHFENTEYIWMVIGFSKFLNDCQEAYVNASFATTMINIASSFSEENVQDMYRTQNAYMDMVQKNRSNDPGTYRVGLGKRGITYPNIPDEFDVQSSPFGVEYPESEDDYE